MENRLKELAGINTNEHFKNLLTEFNNLSERDQWVWILKNKDKIEEIHIDEDMTTAFLKGDNENNIFKLKTGSGHSSLIELLNIIGINARSI